MSPVWVAFTIGLFLGFCAAVCVFGALLVCRDRTSREIGYDEIAQLKRLQDPNAQ